MRIALLADTYPPANRGGAGVVAQRLARAFAARGHDVLVVTTWPDATSEASDGDVRVQRLQSRYPERIPQHGGHDESGAARRGAPRPGGLSARRGARAQRAPAPVVCIARSGGVHGRSGGLHRARFPAVLLHQVHL